MSLIEGVTMKDKKLLKCSCCSGGKVTHKLQHVYDHENGSFFPDLYWVCCNCEKSHKFQKRELVKEDNGLTKNQNNTLKKIKVALNRAGNEKYPVKYKVDIVFKYDRVLLDIEGGQGDDSNMLWSASFRMISIFLTPSGGIDICYDSKEKDKAFLKKILLNKAVHNGWW